MMVASEDSENLWMEIFYNIMPPGLENMCTINTESQTNYPFEQTTQVLT